MIVSFTQEQISKFQNKRLICTATTSCSGTSYLIRVLRFVTNAVSYHESNPEFFLVVHSVKKDCKEALSVDKEVIAGRMDIITLSCFL